MGARVQESEFLALDLRCHGLLAGVELHDVWAIELADGGPERTMLDVRRAAPHGSTPASHAVRVLVAVRRALGAALGWDRERRGWSKDSYVHRLTDEDRARSLVAPGTRDAGFTTLYVFSHEALAEIRNATVHAFLATTLRAR